MGTSSCGLAKSAWVSGLLVKGKSGSWRGVRVGAHSSSSCFPPTISSSCLMSSRVYQLRAPSTLIIKPLQSNCASVNVPWYPSCWSTRRHGSNGSDSSRGKRNHLRDGSSVSAAAGDCHPPSSSLRVLTSQGKQRTEEIPERGVRKRGKKGSMKQKVGIRAVKNDGLSLLADGAQEEVVSLEVKPFVEKCGSIHLILGPMFAGKSTALLKRAQEEVNAGRKVALVKSDKDSRYGLNAVVTHDGVQMPCYAVPDLASFRTHVGDKTYREFDVIGIDEAQFFTDLYDFCLTAADYEGKTVIAAGLDGDFLRRRFGSTVDLVRVADSVVKLSSRCEICGRPAIFSFRKTLDIQTEIIGGADVYMPVCRQHYVGGQMVMDTACTVLEAHQAVRLRKED
ncbi:hypothetical protein R1sor_002268 [Riccia sorocarpa]|uniref:thymidine kinase n=1 Tax=Riccia sorocarpa TaxID=122646 RepID=A0ABD3H000_9MARC